MRLIHCVSSAVCVSVCVCVCVCVFLRPGCGRAWSSPQGPPDCLEALSKEHPKCLFRVALLECKKCVHPLRLDADAISAERRSAEDSAFFKCAGFGSAVAVHGNGVRKHSFEGMIHIGECGRTWPRRGLQQEKFARNMYSFHSRHS